MFEVAEWIRRYEVSIKGREPKDGEELRVGPLQYVRLKVYGHKQGAGFRRLKSIAGDRTMEVFGIFCKFLEISGNQPRERRGTLLNEKDKPASIQDLAFLLDVPDEQIDNAIKVLTDEKVGWILNPTQHNKTQLNSTQAATKKRNVPETPGNIGLGKEKSPQALVLEFDRKLKILFGEQTTTEKKTFCNIRLWLLKNDKLDQGIVAMMDAKEWAERKELSNVVAKKTFVNKIKEMGYVPGKK